MEHGFFHPERGYWQTTDDVPAAILATYPEGTVEVPLQPVGGATWSGTQWLPPAPPTLDEQRATARMSRKAFCLAVKAAGILSPEDAVQAAKGDLPASFRAALEAQQIDGDDAAIIWATSAEIWRTDPLIEILAALPEIGAATADALFGIEQ